MDRFLIKLPKKTQQDVSVDADTIESDGERQAEVPAPNTVSNLVQICDDEHESEEDIEMSESDSVIEKHQRKKNKYKQHYRKQWQSEFKWLKEENDNFSFNVCFKQINGNVFHIRRHEKSVTHINKFKLALKTRKLPEFIEESKPNKLHNSVKNAELKLTAYVCEHNLPFSLMDTLPQLCRSLFPDSKIAKSLKIKRKKATQLCVSVIGPYAKKVLTKDLKSTKFSIIIDETTDISTKKSLVVLARFWKNNYVVDKFLDLILVESATAESLFNSIINLLNREDIPIHNAIGFGADNASTMMGHLKGVQARLKEIVPNIVVIGCTCHYLHLCASNACKKLPNNIEQFTRDVYSYFSNSSKRLEELNECQVFVNETPHKMLYPSQTRWLSLRAVSDRMLMHWNSLTLFFQRAPLEDNLPTARSILNALNNPIYKLYMLFLSYILEIVVRMNIEFQSEKPKLPLLLERVSILYKTILKSFVKKEHILAELNKINVSNPEIYLPLESIYYGAKADILLESHENLDKNDVHNFKLHALDFYIELCKQIKSRFDFSNPHLKFAANFTPSMSTSGDILSIAKFHTLYPNLDVDVELVNIEWQLLSECDNLKTKLDLTEFWSEVNDTKNSIGEPMFPNLMVVVKYVLSLPHSSAAAERIFSQLTLIKSKVRNKLLINTCAQILHTELFFWCH